MMKTQIKRTGFLY